MKAFWQLKIFWEQAISKLREKRGVILTSGILNASNLEVPKICTRQQTPHL